MIDLGHWFQETYTVPLKETVAELEEESDESTPKDYQEEQDTDQEDY